MDQTKPFIISKHAVMQAFKLVKKNAGSAGIDDQSIEDFEEDLKSNLYKLWNRLSSGSYFPPAVKAVPIPKKSGGTRILGIPTVADRIAQMVVKQMFEPNVEKIFLADSYGYRPGKAALDAVAITRSRCFKKDWVLEFDIKGLFDNIPHDLLEKAVEKHTDCKWVRLYIRRWLKASMKMPDGTVTERTKGVPQGGVISPVLSNLFLHYVFDVWVTRRHPHVQWCRYADDGLLHCTSLKQAESLRNELAERFKQCGLELHPDKTKIVYCKDEKRRGNYAETKFDFLGYTFRARRVVNPKTNKRFQGFTPAVSNSALKSMRQKIRDSRIRNRTDLSLDEIAVWLNPILQGWINYYGKYYPSGLYPILRHLNKTLVAWAMRKHQRLHRRKTRAAIFMEHTARRNPKLFAHWRKEMLGAFA